MKAFKGFNKDLKCRDFQYEIGKEYKEKEASLCNKGFHACEYPLDCFGYYAPAESRFCEVEVDATDERHSTDTKICGTKIKIGAEIGIPRLIKAAIEYTKAHTTTEFTDPERATAGNLGAATAGYKGAATAGDYGAATAGNSGAATAGYKGAATAGNLGAATSRGTAATGENGLSVARGNGVKVKGGIGAVLVIVEENSDDYNIKEWASAVVDGERIKADTWYCLKEGKITEAD